MNKMMKKTGMVLGAAVLSFSAYAAHAADTIKVGGLHSL